MTKQGLFGEDGSLVKSEFMKMVSNGDAVIDKAVIMFNNIISTTF